MVKSKSEQIDEILEKKGKQREKEKEEKRRLTEEKVKKFNTKLSKILHEKSRSKGDLINKKFLRKRTIARTEIFGKPVSVQKLFSREEQHLVPRNFVGFKSKKQKRGGFWLQ